MSEAAWVLMVAVCIGGPTLWLAARSVVFTFFLSGAFFVSSGTLAYLYFAEVSVPLLGTDVMLTPTTLLYRASAHALFFLLCTVSAGVRYRRAARSSRPSGHESRG